MSRFFNTAGPCRPEDHYTLPSLPRLPKVMKIIEQKGYFVIHAPRQTGKTTAMLDLADRLTASGKFISAVVSMEIGAAFPDDIGAMERAVLSAWQDAFEWQLPDDLRPPPWPVTEPGSAIRKSLQAWVRAASRPVILFIDEIDAIQNSPLISVLRQLRDGYPGRPKAFPWSLALIGMRDVRDYKAASGGGEQLNTSSPFNIKIESMSIGNFTLADVTALYHQHTDDTGQKFTPEAIALAFELTSGQPWLVNALANRAVSEIAPDPETDITPAIIEQARRILIARQDTHLDSLAERLREPRIRSVLEPILSGSMSPPDMYPDDIQYALDLGLVQVGERGDIEIANPVYREIIPRVLGMTARLFIPALHPVWLNADGSLNPKHLLIEFLRFWKQHGQPLMNSAPYHEIAPHLVMMAFLDRVANSGGGVDREYATGAGRMDLCLRYGAVKIGIEIKVWRDGESDPLTDGLLQIDRYLSGLELSTGWLVIFNRRSGLPPISDRTTATSATSPAGRDITVIRG